MPELPTVPRLAFIGVLAVVGFVVGPVVDVVQSWRNRRLWEGDDGAGDALAVVVTEVRDG